MKSYLVKTKDIQKKWKLVDAKGVVLGRLATRVAMMLTGKDKPSYAPHQDGGDFVIVINAKDVKVTGDKANQKMYRHYTGFPGGMREIVYKDLQVKKPAEIIRHAVKSMLPHNNLGRRIINHLKVYSGSAHEHAAQQPVEIKVASK